MRGLGFSSGFGEGILGGCCIGGGGGGRVGEGSGGGSPDGTFVVDWAGLGGEG